MIYILCGDIRIGKTCLMTYLATQKAQDAAKNAKMREKVANLLQRRFNVVKEPYALYADYNITYDNMHGRTIKSKIIDPLKIGKSLFIRPYSTIAINEGQTYFHSHEWQQFTPKQAKFFQTSGHYGLDIYFDTQNLNLIEGSIRGIAKIIEVKNLTIFDARKRKTVFADKYDFSYMTWDIVFYNHATDYERQKEGKRQKITAKYNVFDTYNSYEHYDDFLPENKDDIII